MSTDREAIEREERYEALHDQLCVCGTPASALTCPLAVGIVGERCCKGCPDCMGIGSREHLKAMFVDILKVVGLCEQYETDGWHVETGGYRLSTRIRDVLRPYWEPGPITRRDATAPASPAEPTEKAGDHA